MKLEQKVATITAVNPRKEQHGEKKVLAVDVGLKIACDASVLDQFDASLKGFVYGEHGPRYPELGSLGWGREFENCELRINKGEYKGVTVRKIHFLPETGEAVTVSCLATFYPENKHVGALSDLLQEQVVVTLAPTQQDLVDGQKAVA
jgi:hypothetical protein